MRKILSIIYLVVLLVGSSYAQSSYPIFVSTTLTPPYSLKLSDYSKFGSQQLVVNIAVNDLNVSNLPVKLHIKLETAGVTIETPLTINTTPIYLDGGAATVLFGDDLKDYFDINNLIFKGYSKETYRRTGQLPEGFYKITVEVLHFQTNRLISNAGTATAWIAIGKPPVLKLPENGVEMGEFKGMPIVFSWYASKLGSPVPASGVQYKFEMWEMRIDGISPYTIAASVPVFYEETTTNTMISVFPSTLLMEPGMKYAWRVTATDMSGMVPFEQDGHSEIRVFTYKSKCNPVANLKAVQRGRNGSFTWDPSANHTSYNVELRNPATGWLSASETFNSSADFYDLSYGTTYEMRVQAVCDNDPESVSDFSEWKTLEIPAERAKPDSASCPTCGCSDDLGAGTIDNLELKRDLKPGDTLTNRFGTTRFIVQSVESQGDGVYKGHFLFWAELWKLKFVCEYWDLSVNTDNVILNMDYQSVYNPQYLLDVDVAAAFLDSLSSAITDLTIVTSIKDTISVNETITSVYVNAGDSLIAVTVDANGEVNEVVINSDANNLGQTLVTGPNGEEYVVTHNGEVMGVDEYKHTGGNDSKIDDYNKAKEANLSSTQVAFAASPNQKYGFDAYSEVKQTLKSRYPSLQNGYIPAYKSIASYGTDNVMPSTTEKGITFRDEMGIPAIKTGNELTVRGASDGSVTALYAYKALTDTTEQVAGKLNLMSFDEQAKKLYIIPVNGASMPDALTLQGVLNNVYKQAVVQWSVVTIDGGVDVAFEGGHMTHGGSGAIAVYNDDQKSIINKFKENHDFEKDALYLFFVDNVQGKTGDVAGYMPLQRQVGFIYDNPNLFIVAHELGHGTFNLRHTFSPDNLIAEKNSTQNLMDYAGGTELWQHQWTLIHDPQNLWFAWAQDESEGEGMISGSYKLNIVGTNLNIDSDSEYKVMCMNDRVKLQLLRNDTIVKATWKLGLISVSDTTLFTLNRNIPLIDSLKVFDKDSTLLTKISINIFEEPYVFKIVELNKRLQPKSELPVMRRNGKYNIQLFKGDSLIKCNWVCGALKANDATTFTIDLIDVRKDSIKVYDKDSKRLTAFMVNVYNKPDVKLENMIAYDGSFGFDNDYDKHVIRATDANYRSYHLLGTKKWIPWLTVYKAQPNVQLQLKINNDTEFLRDSAAFIKINVSHQKIKASIPTIPGNIIKFSNITSISNTLDLEVVVEDYLDDNQYLYFTDNANDTLAIMSVLCKAPTNDKILRIIELSDSTTSHAFAIDTTQFDTKSYNQAFIDWTIRSDKYKIPQKDFFSKRASTLDPNSRGTIVGMTVACLVSKYGINIYNTSPNEYYLILVPVDNITDIHVPNFLFFAFCLEKTLTPPVFTHATFLAISGDNTKVAIHEIGHGFQLRHTFDPPYSIPIGNTLNFLDYRIPQFDMNTFWKEQWKIINPIKFYGL